MQPYFCTHEGTGYKHCNARGLNQCKYCKVHKPEPQISEERRLHLDHENDEIDLMERCQSREPYIARY